ncbi:unnamed protein product [Ilex paraguariensis]|uniref:Pescadillo homolog n=1 Tax=Ilex paraguariensis TaxID=185542 RepID=A0ABC8S4C5_9AQUA
MFSRRIAWGKKQVLKGKKKEGNAARYITRSQAVKSLQVSLSLFRKLCILKGIFPREPKKKVKGNHHTYYHWKDIMFLRLEPLLEKFREMRAYEKKVKKAISKKNRDLAERLLTRKPSYTLDMLIRERLAEVEGQKITWLTPHASQQVLPEDVDFKIMLTFLEFYETLSFNKCEIYPPILDPRLEALAADLYALSRYFDASSKGPTVGSQADSSCGYEQVEDKQASAKLDESELRLAQPQHQLPFNEPDIVPHFNVNWVPRDSLLFVIPAFGGVVSWEGEGAPLEESDQSITHQVVDKPTQGRRFLSREYVQPHSSTCYNFLEGSSATFIAFVDNEAEGYVPEYAETIKQLQAAARKKFFQYQVWEKKIWMILRMYWSKVLSAGLKLLKLPRKRGTVSDRREKKMGLYNYLSPGEGVLPVLVINTVLSVALLKNMVRSLLQVVGSATGPPQNLEADPSRDGSENGIARRVSIMRYESLCKNMSGLAGTSSGNGNMWSSIECCVCLCKFEGDDKVSE